MKLPKLLAGLAVACATTVGCSTSQKELVSAAPTPLETTPPSFSNRTTASMPEEEIENHFQALMKSKMPDRAMIDYVGELYVLLIRANKYIDMFSTELDEQLAIRNSNPSFKPKEITESVAYLQLVKMWILNDQYIEEISYFYRRLMQIRTHVDPTLPNITPKMAREIHHNLEQYLANTVGDQRVELQGLIEQLQTTFREFATALRKNGLKNGVGLGEEKNPVLANAIFKSPADRDAFIKAYRAQPNAVLSEADRAQQESFIHAVEEKLDKVDYDRQLDSPIVGTERDDRAPNSVPQLQQDNSCSLGHRLCVDSGDKGNIIGSLLPKGYWAFTFDDGPAAKSTSEMMDLVHNYSDTMNPHGKATFFQLAKNVNMYPQWVRKAFDYNFPVANHSFTHADLHAAKTDLHHEITEANSVLTEAYHKIDPSYNIQYFRCPYGSCYAPKVPVARQMIAAQGQIHVYWRIDSLDWKLLNGQKVADLVEKQIQLYDHGVILMHDIHPTTVDAMRIILPWLSAQNKAGKNYRMVTIPEVADLINGNKSAN